MSCQVYEGRQGEGEVHLSGSRFVRVLMIVLGCFFVGLGVIGIFLPIVPTTPFLLLAAACYARGSARFYYWLLNTKTLGPFIRQWREDRTMGRRVKRRAVVVTAIVFAISIAFSWKRPWVVGLLLACSLIPFTMLWRIPVRDEPLDEDGAEWDNEWLALAEEVETETETGQAA